MTTINLRAHHLLCLQSYKGKGYSPEFVAGMSKISDTFKRTPDTKFILVSGADDICKNCPHRVGKLCVHKNPPEPQDEKVMKHFALVAGKVYNYKTVTDIIRQKMTDEVFHDICGTCDWNSTGECKKVLGLGKTK